MPLYDTPIGCRQDLIPASVFQPTEYVSTLPFRISTLQILIIFYADRRSKMLTDHHLHNHSHVNLYAIAAAFVLIAKTVKRCAIPVSALLVS